MIELDLTRDTRCEELVLGTLKSMLGHGTSILDKPGGLDATWRELGIDSLDRLDLALRCEEDLEVKIPDSRLARFEGPRDLVDFLEATTS